MTKEKVKVMLQYTKVLLQIHGIEDEDVHEALDIAIDKFEETCHDLPQSNTFLL